MEKARPTPPALGDQVAPARPSCEALELLALRRSTLAKLLGEPGPTRAELAAILEIGCRVPDHRRLEPWRLVVIEAGAREPFHARLAQIYADIQALDTEEEREKTLEKLLCFRNAPVTICVVSSPRSDTEKARKTPKWEQQLSAGAVCQSLLLAASASGYAAQWVTEWYAYEPRVRELLGLRESEQVAGFVFMGTARQRPLERRRPDLSERVVRWAENG